VEDIHWAEPQLLDLLEYVLGSVHGPLLMIATARPELLQRRPGWGARAGGELLELDPCPRSTPTACSTRCSGAACPPS
jgi:hypothetical protein